MPHLHNHYFTTCTILHWKHLLANDEYKDIIINSFRYFTREGSVAIYAFVIMPNHMHIVWQINVPYELSKIQFRMLKFTAQQMKLKLQENGGGLLQRHQVNKVDRKYQIWKRCSLSKAIFNLPVWWQKVNYIHLNPCRYKTPLAKHPAEYRYSSASYFVTGVKDWDFLADREW
ncbi:MAG: transposase [Saprospiraceae bacterium]|nr:transposase [Saprospiraceae bacterium]